VIDCGLESESINLEWMAEGSRRQILTPAQPCVTPSPLWGLQCGKRTPFSYPLWFAIRATWSYQRAWPD